VQAIDIIETVSAAGGQIWLDGDKVRARLPENLMPLVDVIREMKPQLIELLARRLAMPAGVRLIRWQPVPAPVRLSECSTVTDTEKFIRTTLTQLEAALEGRNWQSGNWGLSGLLERLAAVGCVVELRDRKKMLQ
jgi:hypothetical protein